MTRMGRNALTFLCCVAGIPICSEILPGVHAATLRDALAAGCALGVAYLFLRPILRLVSAPIGCITLGLFGFVIDALLILLIPRLVPGFRVDGIEWAALAALLISGMCLIAGGTK